MTVSEAVIAWLEGYEGLTGVIITTDWLEPEGDATSLRALPETTVKNFVDGSRDMTARYLIKRRLSSQTDEAHRQVRAWMEGLERWIIAQNRIHDLPEMGEKRVCISVEIVSGCAVEEKDTTDALYQISMAVNYFEEV